MKISEKLIERLRKEFPDFDKEIPVSEKPKRCYYGKLQRSIGAWSWRIGGNTNCTPCWGSQWSMSYLLKQKDLSFYVELGGMETSIFPEK